MTFIGRDDELAFLESCYASPKAQLVILYGRRRVGKTETLIHFAKNKPHLFYAAQSATATQQLKSFSEQMFAAGAPAGQYISQYADWEGALADIAKLPAERDSNGNPTRKLIIIDEFPYLVKASPELPSVLQNLWDHTLRHDNVMIVLCGSAMSFIEKEVLSEKSPLYGRATGILNMRAMPYWDAAQFLPDYTTEEQILTYAVLGGIPHYLDQFDPDRDLHTNIVEHILRRGTALYSEVEFLMREEFRETATYNSIIQAVALGATSLNDIAQRTMLSTRTCSTYIANLIEVGIVEREFPADAKTVEQSKAMRGLYQISDNFFRFWFAFVFPHRSELEIGDADGVYRHSIAPNLHDFAATPFERICAAWLQRENMAGTLPFRANRIGRWWNGRDEIDVVAYDESSEHLIAGECKLRTKPVDMDVLRELQRKAMHFAATNRLFYLFSLNGFTSALERAATADPAVRLVSANELYH